MINQSINWSTNQSINRSINQSITLFFYLTNGPLNTRLYIPLYTGSFSWLVPYWSIFLSQGVGPGDIYRTGRTMSVVKFPVSNGVHCSVLKGRWGKGELYCKHSSTLPSPTSYLVIKAKDFSFLLGLLFLPCLHCQEMQCQKRRKKSEFTTRRFRIDKFTTHCLCLPKNV